MSEFPMETRRRSRSKTPFLRSSCDHENCEITGEDGHVHHTKKKAAVSPNVQTIVEEAVEVTSSSATPSTRRQKMKTSDYSSEDNSPELRQKSAQTSTTTTTKTTATTIITRSQRSDGVLGNATTSTPKVKDVYNLPESFAAQFSSTGIDSETKESAQNELNAEFERSQLEDRSSRANLTAFISRMLASSFGTASEAEQTGNGAGNGGQDTSDHLAYLEYKRAGEYWKTTPKTDYTYSELSPHRRFLAPGVVAMPNMSRRSLEIHHERINHMIRRDPGQEAYIRRRYETSEFQRNRQDAERLAYDSGDEVDYEIYRKRNGAGASLFQKQSWFMRIVTTVVTVCSSTWSKVTGISGGAGESDGRSAAGLTESSLYYTHIGQEQKGVLGSIWHGIATAFLAAFRSIYLFISSVLCMDTWLLQSSNPDNKNKKRFLLALLLLLPFLLLAGLFYYLHPHETFPPRVFSEYTFTLPQLPDFPKLPELPKIDLASYYNDIKVDNLKERFTGRLQNVLDYADDYLMYLRTVSQNMVDEGRKLFQREEYFERV